MASHGTAVITIGGNCQFNPLSAMDNIRHIIVVSYILLAQKGLSISWVKYNSYKITICIVFCNTLQVHISK